MDITAKLPQVLRMLTQPENNIGLLVWFMLMVATGVFVYKLRSRFTMKRSSSKVKNKDKKRFQSIGWVYAAIGFSSLLILFGISLAITRFEVRQAFAQVEENYRKGEKSAITCSPLFACDVLLLQKGQAIAVRSARLLDDAERNQAVSSQARLFDTFLMVDRERFGLFRESRINGDLVLTYISADQAIHRLWVNYLQTASLLSLLLLIMYFGLVRRIRKSLTVTKLALVDGDGARLANQPQPLAEIAALQEAAFHFGAVPFAGAASDSGTGLNLVSYSFADLKVLRYELFEPLAGLGATSLRLLPMGEEADASALSSRDESDPYSKVDPIIQTLAAKTGELFLDNTAKLFKNTNAAGQFLPGSLFFVCLQLGETPLGVLWGGFSEPRSFTAEDKELVKEFVAQITRTQFGQTAKTAVAESEIQKLNAIIRSTPDPLLLLGADFTVKFANKDASTLFGMDFEKAIDSSIHSLGFAPTIITLLSSNTTNETNTEITLKNGKTYNALSRKINVMKLHNARLWIFRDITNFKEQERLKSEFVNTVSHDLRGPLSLIRGYANMIEMVGSLNEQQGVYATKINDSIEEMSKLINSLLDLGRIDAGVSMQFEIVPAWEFLDRICAPIQVLAIQKRITFSKEFTGKDSLIQLDPGLVQQAVGNLLENAIKYSNEGCSVSLKANITDGKLNLTIQDNGLGIARADQQHLFEKFYRGKKAEIKARKGSGLGLAIVKSIVEHHKGQVWFESEEGVGSNFYISLPVKQ